MGHMKNERRVMWIIWLWPLLFSTALTAATWEFKDNCDVPNDSLKVLEKVSREDCQAACEEQSECKGILYITGWQRCTLKTRMDRTARLKFISGEMDDKRAYSLHEGFDHSGKDRERQVLDSADACGKACGASPDCAAFTYLDGYRVCWLKNKGGRLRAKNFLCGVRK
jgi:hypothetical protein